MGGKGWTVRLVERPREDVFRANYFPRNFWNKRDARQLVDEVARRGGRAEVVRKGSEK